MLTVLIIITLVPKPGTMASGVGISLPEVLQGDNAKSWFKRFEVCAVANEWGDEKKLRHVPTLLKGRTWAVYEALTDAETDTYGGALRTAVPRYG